MSINDSWEAAMRFLVRFIITLIALYAAVWLINGIEVVGSTAWVAYTVMAVVLSLVNMFVKPILKFLSCGLIAATLGLFLLVINTFVLWLASWICVNLLGIGFVVDGVWPAFLGSLIISAVSFVLTIFVPDDDK
jgi:putative membrane protein